MSTFVKICGLRDAGDVSAAVGAGANAVGFVFAESVRRISPASARAAVENLAEGVQRVAVMRHPSNDECQEIIEAFKPDVIQTDAEDFATLEIPEHIECWPVYREGRESVEASDIYVYEGQQSGAGKTIDWTRAAKVAKHGRMLLAGGLAEDNVRAAIQTVQPWGVDVSSGVESLPGTKDHELIERFIGAVRAAEREI